MNLFVAIDKYNSLMSVLINGPSKQILVSLGIKHVENTISDTWRDVCHSYNTPYWNILNKVFSVMGNCLISNKVNWRTPKCNTVLQTEEDLFHPEIQPNSPKSALFDRFRLPKFPNSFGHYPVKD